MTDFGEPKVRPPWYRELPALITAAVGLLAAVGAGFSAYGKIDNHDGRIKTLEEQVAQHRDRLTAIESHEADSTNRLERIENKLDRVLTLRSKDDQR